MVDINVYVLYANLIHLMFMVCFGNIKIVSRETFLHL